MKTAKKAGRARSHRLAEVRDRHVKRLKKVEKARMKLEKARGKLQKLEAEIALLASADARPHGSDQDPPRSGNLRPARLIFNPRSSGARNGPYRLENIVDRLRAYGIGAEVGLKTSGRVARMLAKEAVEQGMDLVIVAAGDGTIEDVAAQLAGTNTTLGIIPIGTMNNIARSLGVPLDLDDACALLSMGVTRHIDVGRVITGDKPHGVAFLETAGVGLSALAIPLGQSGEKGRWATFMKKLGKFFTFKAANVEVSCDDGVTFQARTWLVTVSNAPLFAKNMLVVPDAKMDDGLLDIALYDGMGLLDLERYFVGVADGKRVDEPRITFHRARRVRISADIPLEANADLDVLAGQQTWEIDIAPGALSVVAGKGVALTLPVESVPSVPPLAGPQPPAERDGEQRRGATVPVAGQDGHGGG